MHIMILILFWLLYFKIVNTSNTQLFSIILIHIELGIAVAIFQLNVN